tara:strand:+ start:1390 stop:1572 length:183 start_codon:yes stop_codon:yes gene_type:complete
VHFHSDNKQPCDASFDSWSWDNGLYFKDELVKSGVMEIFAHFEPVEPQTPGTGRKIQSTV